MFMLTTNNIASACWKSVLTLKSHYYLCIPMYKELEAPNAGHQYLGHTRTLHVRSAISVNNNVLVSSGDARRPP